MTIPGFLVQTNYSPVQAVLFLSVSHEWENIGILDVGASISYQPFSVWLMGFVVQNI